MRVLTAVQGDYGRRIVKNIKEFAPEDWIVETIALPRTLPLVIDEPEEFLPSDVESAELLLTLIESEGAAQLISALTQLCSASAVLVPVDNPAWLPLGLQNQIQQELNNAGVCSVFPRTFCTLTEDSAGFRGNARSYDDKAIASFAKHFGKPRIKLILDPQGERIVTVTVERGSPCGSTRHVAEKLAGIAIKEVVPLAGLIVHQYPCLASMQQDEIDRGMFEPVMNISGYVMNDEVERNI